MRHQLWLALASIAMSATASAAEIGPKDVVYDGGTVARSLTGVPGDPKEGVRIMTTNALGNCVACHTVGALPDVQFPGNIGPALDGAASRWNEAQLRGIVANAKLTFDGTFMPAFYKNDGFVRPGDGFTGKAAKAELHPILSAQQIEDVVAYLLTLKD